MAWTFFATSWRKLLLILAGILVCLYAVSVLWYVQWIPDIGLRCAFHPTVQYTYPDYPRTDNGRFRAPESGDTIVQVGDRPVKSWLELLKALVALRDTIPVSVNSLAEAEEHRATCVHLDGEKLVRVEFQRPLATDQPLAFACWCRVGHLPLEDLAPSILWFFLKGGLFLVGALVFWKRPADVSARQFFLLCIVTLGAYMGGYHWSRISTQPILLLVFMVCGVLLPAVLLHFYLVFPRPKTFLQHRPGWTLLAIYVPPVLFLMALVGSYLNVLLLARGYRQGNVDDALATLFGVIFVYLGVATVWYLASVACLVHSYRTAHDGTQRNQVKWIMFGSLVALTLIAYTLYLAAWKRDDFGTGAATWPMFAASVCFTVAFTISITRYRLMQLDQLLSSGMVYFLISFLAGLGYYTVVFLGMLLVGSQIILEPSLQQAFWVSTTALVLLVVLDLFRSRLKKVLDRRFDREKYQLDRTLRRMGQAIEQLVDPPTLARRLLQACADLLNVARGAVYLREGDPPIYRLAGCLGPTPPLTELSLGCPVVEALQAGIRAQGTGHRAQGTGIRDQGSVLSPDPCALIPDAGVVRADQGLATAPAQRQLRFLGGVLAYALVQEGQLLALLILGPKELGLYGHEDLNLLAAFAQLTALALESAERHRTIEGLNRELRAKVEKISEQQRRILALQGQLMNRGQRTEDRGQRTEDPAPTSMALSSVLCPLSSGIIGSSLAVQHLLQLVRKVSASSSAVLLRGESGTGKELLARALHENSPRAGKAFVKVHCAALSPGLLESELFGHVKGAFTGAHRDKVGRFELADGGTLFLDEIGDISLEVQTKLLRVLQEMIFERVGSSEPVKVNVRLIAATHQDLEALIRQSRFREDLFYRLNVISLPVPALRERCEDLPELALHFLRLYAQRSGKAVTQIEDDALAVLKAHSWPGNIRELENVIERAVVVVDGPTITVHELPPELVQTVQGKSARPRIEWSNHENGLPSDSIGLRAERAEFERREREQLVRALAAADGNKAEAARALGLARSTLVSRLKKYGLS
jgi:transcriptional regulator with GAF, ATPase, and Fis domain